MPKWSTASRTLSWLTFPWAANKLLRSIVAVHGLGSSVETTWTHKTSGKLWLRDFLHLDFPKARIMTYRHDSGWKSQALVKDLADHGRQFLSALEGRRATEEVGQAPQSELTLDENQVPMLTSRRRTIVEGSSYDLGRS